MKNKFLLEITVFTAGAVVMVFEIIGSRVLAPYLGTSTFIWTSLIGVILGSMSLGYYLGGKWADHKATEEMFALIFFMAAMMIAVMVAGKEYWLGLLQSASLGLKMGSLLASLVLFAPASVFLGMVTPYAVKLKMRTVASAGSTVGTLYAISTVGSIAGTFVAGFWLLPVLGNTRILFLLAIILLALSLMVFYDGWRKIRIAALVMVLAMAGVYQVSVARAEARGFIDRDTAYNRVLIYDDTDRRTGEPVRRLSVGNESSSAMFLNSEELVFEYTKFYRLARHFVPGLTRALMIGGGAYSYPKDFLKQFPAAKIDVVEIDPALTALATAYFRLPADPRLTVVNEDGRVFLNTAPQKYDVIFGDAFRSRYSLPYQLTTVEAVQKMHDRLNDNGAVMVNVISPLEGDGSDFLRAETATFKKVFPQVFLFATNAPNDALATQNVMLVALKSGTPPAFHDADPELQGYLKNLWTKAVPANLPVLTDDFAPVDSYIQKLL